MLVNNLEKTNIEYKETLLSKVHGRRKGKAGGGGPWILKISAKKVVFLVSEKTNFTTFGPPGKFGKTPRCPPWKKILPTAMHKCTSPTSGVPIAKLQLLLFR